MTAHLDALLRLGTGPRRLRADLRVHADAVRALAVAARRPRTVGTTVGAEMASGPLLDVVGERLRGAVFAAAPAGTAGGHRGPHAAQDVHPVPMRPEVSSATTQITHDHAPVARDGSLVAPSEPLVGPTRRTAGRGVAPRASGDEDGVRLRHEARAQRLADADASRSAAHPAPPTPASPVHATRESPTPPTPSALRRGLDRYWELARAATAPATDASAVAAAAPPRGWTGIDSGPTAGPEAGTPEWARRAADGCVRELADVTRDQRNSRSTRLLSGGEPTVEVHNVFHVTVRSADVERGDLAERLADLLHEQVVRHGIELS